MKAIALLEAAKGSVVLLAALGLLRMLNRDVEEVAVQIIEALHLDPAKKIPGIFIHLASKFNSVHLWQVAALALAYATLRLAEAYGLWRERAWAEWLAIISGGIYLPVEIYELCKGFTWLRIGTLLTNVAVLIYMGWSLRKRQMEGRAAVS